MVESVNSPIPIVCHELQNDSESSILEDYLILKSNIVYGLF